MATVAAARVQSSLRRVPGAILVVAVLIGVVTTGGGDDVTPPASATPNAETLLFANISQLEQENQLSLDYAAIQSLVLEQNGNRTKRQTLMGLGSIPGLSPQPNPNGGGGSAESLLASCQLTNLLLYQLLQQKQATIPTVGAFGGIQQNLVNANPYQESLSTYLSTSTYVTTMTSTALVTIPLLFGNKPSPTTITRTKTYEVTTSDILTLTTTIKPTITKILATETVTAIVTPTPLLQLQSLESVEAELDKLNESGDESRENLKIKNRYLEAGEEEIATEIKPSRSTIDFSKISKVVTGGDKRAKANKRRNSNNNNSRFSPPQPSPPPISKPKLRAKDSARRGSSPTPAATTTRDRDPAQYKILRDNRDRSRHTPTVAPVQPEPVTQKYSYNQQQYQQPPQQYESPRRKAQQQPVQQQVVQQQVQEPAYYEDDYLNYGYTPEQSYAQPAAPAPAPVSSRGRQAAAKQQVQVQNQYYDPALTVDTDPYGANAYDYNNGYYNRRLKRRGPAAADAEEDPEEPTLEREYLLEPSFQGDGSQGFEQLERCPPVPQSVITKTFTETKTVTKYLTTTVTPAPISTDSRNYYTTTNYEEPVRTTPRSRGRVRFRSSTTPASTEATEEEHYPRRNVYRRQYVT